MAETEAANLSEVTSADVAVIKTTPGRPAPEHVIVEAESVDFPRFPSVPSDGRYSKENHNAAASAIMRLQAEIPHMPGEFRQEAIDTLNRWRGQLSIFKHPDGQ